MKNSPMREYCLRRYNYKVRSMPFDALTARLVSSNTSLEVVENIIYSTDLLNDVDPDDPLMDRLFFLAKIWRMTMEVLTPFEHYIVTSMFNDRFKQEYNKASEFKFSDKEVDLVKEIIWVAYYVKNKKFQTTVRRSDEVCTLLLGCNKEYFHYLKLTSTEIFKRVRENIRSLKDDRFVLLPHYGCVNPIDLNELAKLNKIGDMSMDDINLDPQERHRCLGVKTALIITLLKGEYHVDNESVI